MIRKKWFSLVGIVGIIMAYATLAAQITENKYYTILKHPITTEKSQVLVFFSFYCSHCYQLEKSLNFFDKIKKALPKDIKIRKYHIGFWGPLGKDLTRSWAIAIAFGIEDKILLPMFKEVQKTMSTCTTADIRNVFIEMGVKDEDYDTAWNSSMIERLVMQQNKAVEDFRPHAVPSIFVNGKYQVNPQGMDNSNINIFLHQFIGTIKYLVKKDQINKKL